MAKSSRIYKFRQISTNLKKFLTTSTESRLNQFFCPSLISHFILPLLYQSSFPISLSHTLQQPLLPSLPLSLHFFLSFLFLSLLSLIYYLSSICLSIYQSAYPLFLSLSIMYLCLPIFCFNGNGNKGDKGAVVI